ncbi:hypothetical protein D3C81_1294870 [compost metagenome]
MKFSAIAHPRVARLQNMAINTRLLMRPQRSASNDKGIVSTPTIIETILLSIPNCASLKAHSALSSGKTALSTWRDM